MRYLQTVMTVCVCALCMCVCASNSDDFSLSVCIFFLTLTLFWPPQTTRSWSVRLVSAVSSNTLTSVSFSPNDICTVASFFWFISKSLGRPYNTISHQFPKFSKQRCKCISLMQVQVSQTCRRQCIASYVDVDGRHKRRGFDGWKTKCVLARRLLWALTEGYLTRGDSVTAARRSGPSDRTDVWPMDTTVQNKHPRLGVVSTL